MVKPAFLPALLPYPSPPAPGQEPPALGGLRIGFFTSVRGMGGSEILVADAMEAAYREGAEVVCWCPKDAAMRQIVAARGDALRATFLDWPPGEGDSPEGGPSSPPPSRRPLRARLWRALAPTGVKRLLGFWREARAFERELRQLRPDLFVVNVNGSEAAVLAGKRFRFQRTISCYHLSVAPLRGNLVNRLADWLLKTACMWASPRVVHTSGAVRQQWCRLCLYPSCRTQVIYNGVEDPGQGRAPGRLGEFGVDRDDFVFCVPARLDRCKGHRYLLEALAGCPEVFAKAKVLLCGDGPARQDLQRRCDAAGLGRTVRFLGWRPDVKEILRASDCAVLPSIESENLSLGILEALMAGVPAIVTAVGGMAEAVCEGRNGLVVPPASAEALRRALVRMLADRPWARRLGAQARRDALQRFCRARMMDEYAKLFRQLVGRGP